MVRVGLILILGVCSGGWGRRCTVAELAVRDMVVQRERRLELVQRVIDRALHMQPLRAAVPTPTIHSSIPVRSG